MGSIAARDHREGGVSPAFGSTPTSRLQIAVFCKIRVSLGLPGDQSRSTQLTTALCQTLRPSGQCSGQGFRQAFTAREGNQSLSFSGSCV